MPGPSAARLECRRAMNSPDHVLIVDDDAELRQLLGTYLQANGFRVSVVADGREMRRALQAPSGPDLVVLDVMMPGEDGLAICRSLRADSNLPIIMLTARGEDVDRIIGLEMGADDYLSKPFNPRELLARIKALLRRARALPPGRAAAHKVRFAGWVLDLATRELRSPEGTIVPLSGGEFRLLSIFVEHPNRVLDRNQLMDLSLGRESSPFDRAIDVQVSRLRARLRDVGREPAIIKTVRNEGYVLAAAVERVDK